MKKLTATVFAAIVAISAFARTSIISLENGETKLDIKYVKYGAAELLGIECITANDTGDVALSVGKHMEAKQRVDTYTDVYTTNIVEAPVYGEWYFHDQTNIVWKHIISPYDHPPYEPTKINQYFYFPTNIIQTWEQYESHSEEYENLVMVYEDNEGTDPQHPIHVWEFIDGKIYTGIDPFPETLQFGSDGGNAKFTRARDVVGYTMQTNIIHTVITNSSWKTVSRTCYQNVVSTNLTDGIVIQYFSNPIHLFRNDYLRLTSPIDEETNPGKFLAIIRD